jgi:HlyD family secretion protein
VRLGGRLLLGGALAAGALGAAALFLPLGGQDAAVPVVTAAPAAFVRQVPAEGNLRAVRATPLTVPAGVQGLPIAWLAPDGSRVRAGDTVARFDPSAMEKQLADAEAELATARFKITKAQAESRAATDKLAGDAAIAEAELEAATRFQKKDQLIFSRAEIIESDVDEQLARARERHSREGGARRRALDESDLGLLEITAHQAQLKIDRARTSLQALAMTAPHDGILVFRRDWRGNTIKVGDSVWEGQPLADIPELSRMEAEVFVLEADAGGLAPGKPATVELESTPGRAFPARIARVEALAKPRFRGSPVQYFAVVLALAETLPVHRKPGARVRAWITLDRLPAALAVPRQAVFELDGRKVVYRRGGGRFEPVPVTLGPSGMGRVVLTRGIAAGDVLALVDPTRASSDGGPAAPSESAAPSAAPSGLPSGPPPPPA